MTSCTSSVGRYSPKTQNLIQPPATNHMLPFCICICISLWRMSWFHDFRFCFPLEISLAWITLNAFPKKVKMIESIGAQGKEFQLGTEKQHCSRVTKRGNGGAKGKCGNLRRNQKFIFEYTEKTMLKDEQRSAQVFTTRFFSQESGFLFNFFFFRFSKSAESRTMTLIINSDSGVY